LLIRTLKLIVLDRARILIHDELTRNCTFQEDHRDERQAEQLQLKELSIEDSSLISNGADPRDNLALRLTPVRSSDRASVQSPEIPLLSGREEAILDGLVRGLSNKQIARECSITEATVKVHMKSILRKIRVSNRTQAAIWALDRNSRFDVMPTLKS
jgi:two-component system nitrate/nitrite response regulator NarL